MKQASFYHPLDNHRVQCDLCPHHCRMRDGQRGICLTRKNINGTLISENYCRPVSTAVDPIEKKPLFHFFPGSSIFSTGPNGCTFKCGFCQNCEISQEILPTREVSPQWLADKAMESGSIGIAYTYSEPTIWFETIMEVGAILRKNGLKNVMVTNGYIEQAPLRDLLTVVDAMNIDIKSMNPSFYRTICKGQLEPVLATCETVKKAGCHLEITTLLIPGKNDDPVEIQALTDFIATHLGGDTPLHFSRYFPRFKMTEAQTSEELLLQAWRIAKQRLEYVYIGNVASGSKENTLCPKCGALLISRKGYRMAKTDALETRDAGHAKQSFCARCNHSVPIII